MIPLNENVRSGLSIKIILLSGNFPIYESGKEPCIAYVIGNHFIILWEPPRDKEVMISILYGIENIQLHVQM
jgi:hypothetical protein